MGYERVAEVKVVTGNFPSDGIIEAAFDASLWKPVPLQSGNPRLKIELRVNLQQQNPRAVPPVTTDADGEIFWTRPWTGPEWFNFIDRAKKQAQLWNGQFWLKPPPAFTDFDVAYPSNKHPGAGLGPVWRPYIDCQLEVDFNASRAKAHGEVKVANLDLDILRAKLKN